MLEDVNSVLWYGQSRGFSAKERRILITQWVGEAWAKLGAPNYSEFLRKCWQETGCLITADGSEDDIIQPEDLLYYTVPPPSIVAPARVLPSVSPFVNAAEIQADKKGEEEMPN